jgi:hypothetical protein
MQVWSQRKHVENTERLSARHADSPLADVWALRVLGGVHAGAERKLHGSGMLIIGSSDDCDLIFTDPGVASHHCIVNYADGKVTIRAMDADVRIDESVLHPGDPLAVAPFALIRIGGACFALGPHWSERWQTLLDRVEPAVPPQDEAGAAQAARRRSSRVATLGVALVLLCASGAALLLAQHGSKPAPVTAPAPLRDAELASLLQGLGFSHLQVDKQAGDKLAISGYVERDEDMATLRSKLDQRGFANVVVEAKSGPRIAQDLRESLRMQNLHATTKWTGNGNVEITGRFGDEQPLRAALASRTINDLNEKLRLKVAIKNLDPVSPSPAPVPDNKRIRRIVEGDDPYLEAVDKSVYYVNSKLPNGDTFLGLEEDSVVVRDPAGNIRRLPRDSVVDAKSP